jgi:hypothetical protein
MLIRAREIFLERFARSHVVTCREHLPVPAEDYDANIIIRFCLEEGIVEFHQHPTVLRVTCLWPIEHDANDLAIVETLDTDEFESVGLQITHRKPFLDAIDSTRNKACRMSQAIAEPSRR